MRKVTRRVIDMTIDERSLDEAILEFKERAEDSKKLSKLGMKNYIPKAKEEEQIAEWLEELKKRRSEDYGYMADIHQSIGYRKALDDIKEELMKNGFIYTQHALDVFDVIAKRLKERD